MLFRCFTYEYIIVKKRIIIKFDSIETKVHTINMNSTSQLETIWLAQCDDASRSGSANSFTPVYNFKDDINEEDSENKENRR